MAIITTLLGGIGSVAAARHGPAHRATLEWFGGMLFVTSLVGLGLGLGQTVG